MDEQSWLREEPGQNLSLEVELLPRRFDESKLVDMPNIRVTDYDTPETAVDKKEPRRDGNLLSPPDSELRKPWNIPTPDYQKETKGTNSSKWLNST